MGGSESGLADVLVTLYHKTGGAWRYLADEITYSGGNYSFDDLVAGEYGVAFSAPSGYAFTTQHVVAIRPLIVILLGTR